MTRSSTWVATLLGIVLLLGAGSLSARTVKNSAVNQVSAAAPLISAQFAVPSSAVAVWANAIYLDGDDGPHNDKDGHWDYNGNKDDHDREWDHDYHHGKHNHDAPTPEPSTLLSFGAAIVIGGGVLLSRRLRRSK